MFIFIQEVFLFLGSFNFVMGLFEDKVKILDDDFKIFLLIIVVEEKEEGFNFCYLMCVFGMVFVIFGVFFVLVVFFSCFCYDLYNE